MTTIIDFELIKLLAIGMLAVGMLALGTSSVVISYKPME
jgi:hypothetical protein